VSDSKLGVGIIGVNPAWGWASAAHIPALRAQRERRVDLELVESRTFSSSVVYLRYRAAR